MQITSQKKPQLEAACNYLMQANKTVIQQVEIRLGQQEGNIVWIYCNEL